MFIPINTNVLNKCVKMIKQYPEMCVPISSSFASSQLISKIDIVNDIERYHDTGNICILAGWMCIGFKLLFTKHYQIISVDKDKTCETVGKQLFEDISYVTEDIANYIPRADIIINTSTEHIERSLLKRSFVNIECDTTCYFQNTNVNWYDEHINCFKTLEEFSDFLSEDFTVVNAHSIPIKSPQSLEKRFSVKCIKKLTCA